MAELEGPTCGYTNLEIRFLSAGPPGFKIQIPEAWQPVTSRS
jgi:hypothetical protein